MNEAEEYINHNIKRLSSNIQSAYDRSLSGESIYEDPFTEISMGERIPNPTDLFSCTNHLLIKDWTHNHARYQKMHEDPQTTILLEIRVNHKRIGEFIKYQEEKFIKDRELEFREKKKEILQNAGTFTPNKPVPNSLLQSQFRVKKETKGERKGKSMLLQGK